MNIVFVRFGWRLIFCLRQIQLETDLSISIFGFHQHSIPMAEVGVIRTLSSAKRKWWRRSARWLSGPAASSRQNSIQGPGFESRPRHQFPATRRVGGLDEEDPTSHPNGMMSTNSKKCKRRDDPVMARNTSVTSLRCFTTAAQGPEAVYASSFLNAFGARLPR